MIASVGLWLFAIVGGLMILDALLYAIWRRDAYGGGGTSA